jgi:hypothetical protein
VACCAVWLPTVHVKFSLEFKANVDHLSIRIVKMSVIGE